jgi:hypothetical protein
MADSPNTRTLPEIHPSRRAALAGIAGTLALATGAVGAVALLSVTDAHIVALCALWREEWAKVNETCGRACDAESAEIDNRPEAPQELCQSLLFADGEASPIHTSFGKTWTHWSREELAKWAQPGSKRGSDQFFTKDGERHIIMRELPVPEETRIKCRELLAVYDRWEAAVEAGKEEHRALEAIHFEQDDRADEVMEEIAEQEPQSLAGLATMASLLLECDKIGLDSDETDAITSTVLAGVIRLNGGSV